MCTGFSELNGSWKTYCTWLLYWRNVWLLRDVDRLAVQRDRPVVGRSCPASSLATVDLPEPLSPTSATTAPWYRPNETFLHRVQDRAAAQLEVLAEADGLHGERAARGGDRLDDGGLADLLGVRVDGRRGGRVADRGATGQAARGGHAVDDRLGHDSTPSWLTSGVTMGHAVRWALPGR